MRATGPLTAILIFFVCGGALLVAPPAHAGGLAPASGDTRVSLQVEGFSGTAVYDDDGVAASLAGARYLQQGLWLHAEGAVWDRLDLLADVRAGLAHADADDGTVVSVAGGQDAWLRGRYRFVDDGVLVLRGGLGLKLPLGLNGPSRSGFLPDDTGAPSTPARPARSPALTDGQVDVDVDVGFGAAFPFDGFFTWTMGYRLRTGAVSDAVFGEGRFEVGTLDDRLRPRFDLAFINSLDAGPDETVGRGAVTTGPGCLVALTSSLSLDLSARFVFRARNTVGGFLLGTGLVATF